jgi:hypothetical protein
MEFPRSLGHEAVPHVREALRDCVNSLFFRRDIGWV